ncbi:MAG: beta-ureidopropionase [Candidatus Eremiobacteraeota bacterium]|nr:beta-ureidopropionase [Candidatus Eremiobacteraeota bacterium]
MKLAIVQNKPRKGQVEENFAQLGAIFGQLADEERPYDLIVLPEAALTGYFLEGAVYELAFEASALAERLGRLWRAASRGEARPVDVVLGFYENAGTYYNAAMYLEIDAQSQRIAHVHRKMFLPTYGVFDEARFVSRGRRLETFESRFGSAALLICEDAYHAIMPTLAAIKGARMLIVPSASPGRGFAPNNEASGGGEPESVAYWRNVLRSYAAEHGVFVVYAGLAGFEGGKGMAGSSCAIDPFGDVVGTLPALGAEILRVDLDLSDVEVARGRLPLLGDLDAVLPDLLEIVR